ncbi:MAG: cytochrome-c oxidase, cbb3-type subunit II [Armatimonadetes bacterium]|nr:cytochrome-c oxidase, cbb3-type subunit II [Armatimonadota bacterium]
MTHDLLEKKSLLMAVVSTIVILIGGIVEIVPLYAVKAQVPAIAGVKPYTPLEVEGRDIYLREGCYTCHSQMVRPFRDEAERYGPYSKAGEFVYDHPFQWGSKRTGPDLHRVGGKYPNSWHYIHMRNPRDVSPDSIMPNYPWLLSRGLDTSTTQRKLRALRTVGVPYTDEEIAAADQSLRKQADEIVASLKSAQIADAEADREIIALIAYLQRLGMDINWRNSDATAQR